MKTTPAPIDRLLCAAALAPPEPAPAIPFGFDTRVVALWRASLPGDPAGVVRLLRRVMFIAVTLILFASAGAYRELTQGYDFGEPLSDEYAIPDSAIGGAFDQ